MELRSNLYKLTAQNDTTKFVLAKSIQDAINKYELPEGCGADIIGMDSIKKVELITDFEVTDSAIDRIIKDIVSSKEENE